MKKYPNIDVIHTKKGLVYKARVEYSLNGKRKQMSQNFAVYDYGSAKEALKQAVAWRDFKKLEIRQGKINLLNANYSIDEIYERTVKDLSQSLETKRKWGFWYKKYILKNIDGNFPFSKITWDDHIKPSLDAMVNDCSQDMIDRVRYIWGKMCTYAFVRKLVNTNEILFYETSGRIKSKAVEYSRNTKLNMDDFIELLRVFRYHKRDKRLSFIEVRALLIMAYLGLRPAEVFVLETSDFDLKNRTIHIYKRLGSSADKKYVATSLGNKGRERLIPYPSSLDSLINELIEHSENGKLFTYGGIYLNSNILTNDVRRISNGKFNPYMLRHAFSNYLVVNKKNGKKRGDEDVPERILTSAEQQKATQTMMGHSTLKRTYDYTTDVSKDEYEIAHKQEEEEQFNEQVKAVNLRAEELDKYGLCDLEGDRKLNKEKKK